MAYLHLKDGKSPLLDIIIKVVVVIFLLSSLPDLFFGIWQTLWYLVPGLALCFTTYVLNQRGRGVLAGNLFAGIISLLIFFMTITEPKEALVYLYYLPFSIGLPFLIDYTDKRQLWLHTTHSALFWLVLVFYDFPIPIFDISLSQATIIGQVNVVLSAFFCLFFAFMIINTNKKVETVILYSEERLQSQNEMLTKNNQELDRFVYSISHDLRAPVASVLGLTDISKNADTLEESQEYTLLMERSLRRLDGYIHDILDYSRNTRLKVSQDSIDFSKMIGEIIAISQAVSETQAIEVQLQIHNPKQVSFYTDSRRLQIILTKIIANAFYYQKPFESHKKVEIELMLTEYRATVRVTDNGIGIAGEDQEKIFTMFYRSNVTKPGSGLGLYIARETAQCMGGTITCQSKEGEGSTFLLTIPNTGKPS